LHSVIGCELKDGVSRIWSNTGPVERLVKNLNDGLYQLNNPSSWYYAINKKTQFKETEESYLSDEPITEED